ncbi:MAG: bifunctional salicylyl-CoA 5-hydroxylase/oxidoreductase [Planctomycetota bacterium]
MKIVSVGGGPAGLYFSILMKKAFPICDITIFERNAADDTFGFGVVFSDETLSNFEDADRESYREITKHFAYWSDIETYHQEQLVRATGNGFCGIPRVKLLQILHDRCRELGVNLQFGTDITNFEDLDRYDLVLGADGANSAIRAKYQQHFKPAIHWGKCKFSWLGSTLPLKAFTFIFRENEHGLWQIHAYPYSEGRSTFIVECHESVWKRAGFEHVTEEQTVAYFEKLFADHLKGHRLIINRSIWRTFPTIRNERWVHRNIVLVGDAAHTAHFSIGSGTKLAMEDAIALANAFNQNGIGNIPRALEAYETVHKPVTLRIQKAAQTSREWFENCARYIKQDPIQFKFNLMTRSKRITFDNLQIRDAELVNATKNWFAKKASIPAASDGSVPVPMFAPFQVRKLILQNRVVVSPMCQYSSVDGAPNDWHLMHLGERAVGGAGLVFTEATDVSPEGRITHACAGMYNEEHIAGWKRIVEFVHNHSKAKIGMQLAHAGRKGSTHVPWEGGEPIRDDTKWETMAPSAEPFARDWHVPREMSRADMDLVKQQFVDATKRCERAGFDLIELHMAHGYLLSSFFSPLSNRRKDEYGGSLVNRMRYPLEVFRAVRGAWPAEKPVFVRISATDWLDEDGGLTADESVVISKELKKAGCDVVDVSTAGNSPDSKPDYGRMYQLPFAEKIRYEAEIPVMAVGAILDADHVNTIIAAGRADLCAIARGHLSNPHLTLDAAGRYGFVDQYWPPQYILAKPRKLN